MKEKILGSLFLIMFFTVVYQHKRIKELDKEIVKLHSDVIEASQIARDDCRFWMSSDRPLQQANGCLRGIELLCGRTDKPLTCREQLSDVCRELND